MADDSLREHVLYLLRGGGAHLSFEDFVATFPVEMCNQRIAGLPYTAWQVLEHMRIAQWDILEFSRNGNHVSPDFPKGYWPAPKSAGTPELWQQSIKNFQSDLEQLTALVADEANNLHAKLPHGSGQTLLREALLVADHNAYHVAQILDVRRLLGAWKD